jgi:16S rRNA (cytidine1402-2'-O)-methyltransferase
VSSGTLHVVATPLGNLGDLTARAADVLRAVPVVAAEDTRRTRVLLDHVGAAPRVLSLHAHSPPARVNQVLTVLADGADVALVSDAGTPTVSDPGAQLVRRARELAIPVVAVPGPSAVTAALSIAGMPADRYTFYGFLPRRGRERRTLVDGIATSRWTAVVFEAPGRLTRLLHDLATACGAARPAAVARELTKLHEELKSGTLTDLATYYQEHPPRGEVTVIVAGAESVEEPEADLDTVRARARELLDRGSSRKDTASELAKEFSMPKRRAYRIVTEL